MPRPAVELVGVEKDYHGLRPLRIRHLAVGEGDIVVVAGLDATATEVLTNLVTGVSLPDVGDVRVFGTETRAITDPDVWLGFADQVGIVSSRVVLLEAYSVLQNLAVPLTLDLDPLSAEHRAAAERLGAEVGLDAASLSLAMNSAPPAVRLRVVVGRAIALDPRVLLLEHPSAGLPRPAVQGFADDAVALARARRLTVLAASNDPEFSRAMGGRHLVLRPGTGHLEEKRTWRALFRRR